MRNRVVAAGRSQVAADVDLIRIVSGVVKVGWRTDAFAV